jgi:hypothetical protein
MNSLLYVRLRHFRKVNIAIVVMAPPATRTHPDIECKTDCILFALL